MTGNNPKSPVIQNLPPALFTLMVHWASLQRILHDRYRGDAEECGFEHVHTENATRGTALCSVASRSRVIFCNTQITHRYKLLINMPM